MKTLKLILAALAIVITSCENDKSIQKYYVENQEDTDFMAMDFPTSMFANMDSMDAEQKQTLETVKKINVLALQKSQDPQKFETKKTELKDILSDDDYQLLMNFASNGRTIELYYTGDEEAIDELIAFAYDDDNGMVVGRVLGDDMNPSNIIKMVKGLDSNSLNFEGFGEIGRIFGNSSKRTTKSDSTTVDTDSLQVEIDTTATSE